MRARFTHDTVEFFTQGDCGALAVRLHELTGWPVCGVVEGKGIGVDPALRITRAWSHAMVRTPEGLYLDVTGARPRRGIELHWAGCRAIANHVGGVHDKLLTEIRDHWTSPFDEYTPEQRRARACAIARRVLTLYAHHDRKAVDFVPTSWWTQNPELIGM